MILNDIIIDKYDILVDKYNVRSLAHHRMKVSQICIIDSVDKCRYGLHAVFIFARALAPSIDQRGVLSAADVSVCKRRSHGSYHDSYKCVYCALPQFAFTTRKHILGPQSTVSI